MKTLGTDIFGHGFDIVIQTPQIMDQDNHWCVLFISLSKIGADRAAICGCLIDGNTLCGLCLGKVNIGKNRGKW
jgi:hypothetical protein